MVYNSIRGDDMIEFDVVIHANGSGYWAVCETPDGGVNTDGITMQEVERNMYEAMSLYFEESPIVPEYSLRFRLCNA